MRRIKVKKKKANRNAILIEKFDFQNFSWVDMNKSPGWIRTYYLRFISLIS